MDLGGDLVTSECDKEDEGVEEQKDEAHSSDELNGQLVRLLQICLKIRRSKEI